MAKMAFRKWLVTELDDKIEGLVDSIDFWQSKSDEHAERRLAMLKVQQDTYREIRMLVGGAEGMK